MCVCFTHMGDYFFIGDKSGFIYIYSLEFGVGKGTTKSANSKTKISLLKKTIISKNCPITSITFSMCWNVELKKSNPSLLLNTCDNRIRLLSFEPNNSLHPVIEIANYPITQQKKMIRSIFCPLISSQKGAFFVSGSEAGHVFIFDLTKKENTKKSTVNQLMAHSMAVLDVSWNFDETVLASCSEDGTVVIWKNFDSKKEL